jgi:hypothetical protein
MDHYELLANPDWTATSVLVVSPFVEPCFFRRIVRDLAPSLLIVVIDDGCRPDDITMVKKTVGRTKVRVVLGGAPGLVHAKVFHVEWKTAGGSTAHTLVYGSGNATRQAFNGNFNAELMCKVRLTARRHGPILDWLKSVYAAAGQVTHGPCVIASVNDVPVAPGVLIRLPGLIVKTARNKASSFDLWLQRGHLIPSFRPDPGFMRVHIKLLADIPPGEIEQRIKDQRFATPQRRRISIPTQLDDENLTDNPRTQDEPEEDGEEADRRTELWRTRFCTWTQLGDWCSDGCYQQESHQFRRGGYEGRLDGLEGLEALRNRVTYQHDRAMFVRRMRALWSAFGDLDAPQFLRSDNGQFDDNYYREAWENRVSRDLELAEDPEFKSRYLNGCEIIDIPRFRTDPAAWRSFVESFSRQMHLEWLKIRPQSLIYQRIRAAIGDDGVFEEPQVVTKLLRETWNKTIKDGAGQTTTVGDYIDGYKGHSSKELSR